MPYYANISGHIFGFPLGNTPTHARYGIFSITLTNDQLMEVDKLLLLSQSVSERRKCIGKKSLFLFDVSIRSKLFKCDFLREENILLNT